MESLQTLFESVSAWMRQLDFRDYDKNLAAFYIQAIALIMAVFTAAIAISYTIAGRWAYVVLLLAVIAFLMVVTVLVRYGRLTLASNLFIGSLIGLEMIGILYGNGIHSSISILYPVILMIASLILGRRAFVYYVVVCVLGVGFIIFAEHQRLIPPYYPDPPELPLFISYLLMILGSALLIRYITENLQRSLRVSRLNEQQLAAQKSMLDQVGQAVIAADANRRIVYWNRAASDLYGYTAEEVLGRKYDDFHLVDLTPEVADPIRQSLGRNRAWSGELAARRRDGQPVPVMWNIVSVQDGSNKQNGWVAIATDMTEHAKAAQMTYRRTQELSLLNQLGIALASGTDLYATLLALQKEISQLIQADAFYVAIYDEPTDIVDFPIFFVQGSPAETSSRYLHKDPGLTGAVIFSGKTMYLPNVAVPEVMATYHPLDDKYPQLHTFLGIPLTVNARIIGMMSVQSNAVDAYSSEQIQLMENVALHAAIAIDKAHLMDRLQDELTERMRIDRDLRQREAILDAVAVSAEAFFKGSEWNAQINRMLERLGQSVNATHAYLFENHRSDTGELRTSMKFEWVAPGYPADLDNPKYTNMPITVDEQDSWYVSMSAGRPYLGDKMHLSDTEMEYLLERRMKAVLDVPILVDDAWWGTIGFDDMVIAREWTNAEVDAIRVAANVLSAVVKRQGMEAQLQSELEQRKNLIEELSVIHTVSQAATSQLNLHALFDLVARELFHLFDIQEAFFALHNPKTGLVEFPYYRYGDQLFETNPVPLGQGLSSRIIHSRQPLLINQDYERRSAELGVVRDAPVPINLNQISWLGVPVWAGEQVIGVICVQNHERENAFSEADVHLMTTIAASVGIAIQNARLYASVQEDLAERKELIKELEARNAESETLRETTSIVNSTLDVSEAVQRILEQLKRVVPYDSASVWLYMADRAVMVGSSDLSSESMAPGEFPLDDTQPDYPLRDGDVPYILLGDIQEHYPQFRSPHLNYIHAWLAISLQSRGKLIGFISLDARTPDQFTEHDSTLAMTYANQVAVALENARLFTELQAELAERKKLFADLENKNTELERFTYTVSHDLKAPLITIRGFLGFVEKDALEGNIDRLRGDIQRITGATEKMQALLRDLLELSRIGRLMNESEYVPFEELVREALDVVQGRLFENRIAVQVQPNLPMVFGDRPRLVEVLQNLLDNAAKFMGGQPSPGIEIGQAGEENGKPVFFVKDNGIGIAPDHYDRIFGLFNKLEVNSEGTGVGLAIVKRIVEFHGGRIWVESELGGGSTFFFTLATEPAAK